MSCLKIFWLKGKKANAFRITSILNSYLKWFIVLNFAAKNCENVGEKKVKSSLKLRIDQNYEILEILKIQLFIKPSSLVNQI